MKNIIFFVILILFILSLSTTVSAMTEQERQTLINQIKQQILQLQNQLSQLIQSDYQSNQNKIADSNIKTDWCYNFNNNIRYNDTGSDVSALQKALQKEGFYISENEIKNQIFEDYTTIALNYFQKKYKSEILIFSSQSNGTGFVGPLTRTKLNNLYGCTNQKKSVDESKIKNIDKDNINICVSDWQCSEWEECIGGKQTRTCADYNICGTTLGRPVELQFCNNSENTNIDANIDTNIVIDEICNSNWQTGAWTACVNGEQNRTVIDLNNCGTITEKPSEKQSCQNSNSEVSINNSKNNSCTPYWSCSSWNGCLNYYDTTYKATRTCYDINSCGNNENKPAEEKTCGTGCTPYWQCSDYGDCVNGQQQRTCKDLNDCKVMTGQPSLTQKCVVNCAPEWQCGNWAECIATSQFGLQYRTCTDIKCGLGNKAEEQKCCNAAWKCTNWNTCVNGKQTRTCSDLNNCGELATGKPSEEQSCTVAAPVLVKSLITSPLKGEHFKAGSVINISWSVESGLNIDSFKIEWVAYYAQNNRKVINNVIGKTDLSWKIPENTVAGDYLIVVSGTNYSVSTNVSVVGPNPSISIIFPETGEKFVIGNTYKITWKSTDLDKINASLKNISTGTYYFGTDFATGCNSISSLLGFCNLKIGKSLPAGSYEFKVGNGFETDFKNIKISEF